MGALVVYPRDLRVYLMAARSVMAGRSPYRGQTEDGLAYVYPWAAAWLWAPLALLPERSAPVAWMVLRMAAAVAWAWLASMWGASGMWFALFSAAAFNWAMAHDWDAGNVTIIEAALVLGGLTACVHGHPGWGAALIAAGAACKPPWAMLLVVPVVTGGSYAAALAAASLSMWVTVGQSAIDLGAWRENLLASAATPEWTAPSWITHWSPPVAAGMLVSWLAASWAAVELGLGVAADRELAVAMIALAVCVLNPGMRSYSYVMAIIPAWVVLSRVDLGMAPAALVVCLAAEPMLGRSPLVAWRRTLWVMWPWAVCVLLLVVAWWGTVTL